MLVTAYNNKSLNDVLMVMLEESNASDQSYERSNDLTAIYNQKSGKLVAYNFFNISKHLSLKEEGPVSLSQDQVDQLNQLIQEAGFDQTLQADLDPKFVVGYVKECKDHEDSDHLHITQVEVDQGHSLQIVCGASNIAQGQKVVVAKPGAIMPDGNVIWPGNLRGVDSFGMICSARELNIESDQKKGILVLADDRPTGESFEF